MSKTPQTDAVREEYNRWRDEAAPDEADPFRLAEELECKNAELAEEIQAWRQKPWAEQLRNQSKEISRLRALLKKAEDEASFYRTEHRVLSIMLKEKENDGKL